jgi:KDO2-lipid IV(A) lauroyltransferase
VYRALKRGEVVAIVADRAIDGPATHVDFCSGRRMMPTGPAAFALKAGAPIFVAAFVRRHPTDTQYLVLSRRLECASDNPVEVTGAMARAFGDLVAAHPDQWMVFQPGWLG